MLSLNSTGSEWNLTPLRGKSKNKMKSQGSRIKIFSNSQIATTNFKKKLGKKILNSLRKQNKSQTETSLKNSFISKKTIVENRWKSLGLKQKTKSSTAVSEERLRNCKSLK